MNPYCGKKDIFLSDDDIKHWSCDGNGRNFRSTCKVGLTKAKAKKYPCRYFIVRKLEEEPKHKKRWLD